MTKQRASSRVSQAAIPAVALALAIYSTAVSQEQATTSRAIERVNLTSAGAESTGSASFRGNPTGRYVSADGRHVTFVSGPGLVPGDRHPDHNDNIYVRDRDRGITVLISISPAGNVADGSSLAPEISASGRYVTFMSFATNLVAGDTNNATDVFVFDRDADGNGMFDESGGTAMRLASVSSDGTPDDCGSALPSISDDGRYVAFSSCASNWREVAGKNLLPQSLRFLDVFVHDLQTGATIWASPPTQHSTNGFNDDNSNVPSISGDGRYVAFQAAGLTQPVGFDNPKATQIFVRDTCLGAPAECLPSTEWASPWIVPIFGQMGAFDPSISRDGRFVAFEDLGAGLVARDTNGLADIFVYDRQTLRVTRVSVDSFGAEAQITVASSCPLGPGSRDPSITPDGRFVTFLACANNLVADDDLEPINYQDVFLHDRDTDGNGFFDESGGIATVLISRTQAGRPSSGEHQQPAISNDGTSIAFVSYADDLVPTTVLDVGDIYVSAPQGISVNAVSVAEGHSGTTRLTFTVRLFPGSSQAVTVGFATADGSATTGGGDYAPSAGKLTFQPGETSKPLTVAVNGDALIEADESFFLNLSNATNGPIWKPQAVATITNDDATPPPTIAIDDVAWAEGNTATTAFVFSATLSAPSPQNVTVDFATADGTATTADNDYASQAGTLTFAPGQTLQQITIDVTGETTVESNETFFINLTNSSGATVGRTPGVGTIINDEAVIIVVNENISVTDIPGMLPSAMLAISEVIAVTDSAGVLPSAMLAVNENITIIDAPLAQPSVMLHISESIAVTDAVLLTPIQVNQAPTITALADQTIGRDSTTGALSFAVGDVETPAGNLVVTSASSNPALVPVSAMVLGGGGSERTITMTPALNQSGTATITLTVDDGIATAQKSFLLTVNASPSERLLVGLGPFPGGGGWMPTFGELASHLARHTTQQLPWATYNFASGEMHPAIGNVDADPLNEVVIGLGNGGAGWIAVLDDADHNYALLRWIRIEWTTYTGLTGGSVWPAVGDLDGDGRAEIVAGLGPGGMGWIEIFDDATNNFAHVGWRQLDWSQYNVANGETHPAVADLDGDGLAEIVLGLGNGGAGYLQILNGTAPYAHRRWLRVDWPRYQVQNGPTFPAAGDLDGDGRAEIVVGLGEGAAGYLEVFDDAVANHAFVKWLAVGWPAYNAARGETHPAIGNLDGDPQAEIAVGLGSYAANGGWVQVFDDGLTNYAPLLWLQATWQAYIAGGGPTFPAVGRLR